MTIRTVDDTVEGVPRTLVGNVIDWQLHPDGRWIYVDPTPARQPTISLTPPPAPRNDSFSYQRALTEATKRLYEMFPLQRD